MKSARLIIEEIWNSQLENLPKGDKGPAVVFQKKHAEVVVEYKACRRCVLIDYMPEVKLIPDKLYGIEGHAILSNIDEERIAPERFLYEEFIELQDSALLTNRFLPFTNEAHSGFYALDKDHRDVWKKRYELDALKDGPYKLVAYTMYEIPAWCKSCIYGHSSLIALHGQFGLTRQGNVPTLILSSDSSMLIVTMNRMPPDENPIISLEGEDRLQFDGYIEASYSWTRLVPRKDSKKMPTKGLANPVKRAAMQAAQNAAPTMVHEPIQQPAEEPQIEDVKPEQAAEIAAQAEEPAGETDRAGYTAPPASQVNTEPGPDQSIKSTVRSRRVKQAAQDSDMLKNMDALSEYLGSPVPDTMTVQQIEEELRHCRDLGVALTRRMTNLGLAGTSAGSKLINAVKSLVN